jgi:5'-nucleotidase
MGVSVQLDEGSFVRFGVPMGWSPDDSLVIGISSRALFDLDEEDRIYHAAGTDAFIAYQREHEQEVIKPGVAFAFVRTLLDLNVRLGTTAIEIVVMSKNHPDCGIRMQHSLEHHGLRLRRAVFTGGQDLLPYLKQLNVDLFLSKEEAMVRDALRAGFSAGLIFGGPAPQTVHDGVPVLAFDGDAVLFSDEADRVYREQQLAGFAASELANATVPLQPGPLRRFAQALAEIQREHPIDSPPFRIALVTARDFTFCERPLQTLRAWGIRVDQSFFVSDMSKQVMLAGLQPLIFFDDSVKNCRDAAVCTPTVHVPALEETLQPVVLPAPPIANDVPRLERFTSVCRLFLKKEFAKNKPALIHWHEEHANELNEERFDGFIAEFARSASVTPPGRQRRSASAENSDVQKLLLFLENLLRKHRGR